MIMWSRKAWIIISKETQSEAKLHLLPPLSEANDVHVVHNNYFYLRFYNVYLEYSVYNKYNGFVCFLPYGKKISLLL